MHVADVARAHVELLASDVQGAVNVASGEATTIKHVAQLVAQEFGCSDSVDFGAVMSRSQEPPVIVADVARLRDELGFRPQYDLKHGIAQTVQWWKEQGSAVCTVCPAAPSVEAALPANC